MRALGAVVWLVAVVACGSSSSSHGAPDAPAGARDGATGDGAPGSADGGRALGSGMYPSTLGGAAVVGSTGCGTTGATGVQPLALQVAGSARTGQIFVPASYDATKAYPIVFVFHGDGGTGSAVRTQLDLEPDASGEAIFAYPDGADQTWDYTLTSANEDMAFVLAARDQLRASYCIDTTRTFLTGMSRGGFFVNQLACMYGIAEFAAIAPHSSTIEQDDGNAYIYGPPNPAGGPYDEDGNYDFACPSDGTPFPARPILPPPALILHGQCDMESGVDYAEGRTVAEHWGYAAHCSSTPAVAVETSPNPTCAAGSLTNNPTLASDPCYVAPGCTAGHDITFCAIPSMAHDVWADAHTRIWAFFAAH